MVFPLSPVETNALSVDYIKAFPNSTYDFDFRHNYTFSEKQDSLKEIA
jgi:hypothetical protein